MLEASLRTPRCSYLLLAASPMCGEVASRIVLLTFANTEKVKHSKRDDGKAMGEML